MQLTHLTLLLSVALAPTLSQKLAPDAVTTLLQGILSPKNAAQVMKVLSSAASKKRAVPNVQGTVNRRFFIIDNVPKTVLRAETPNKIAQLVQRPQEMCVKKNVMVQSPNVIVQNGNQMGLPKNMIVQRRTEIVLPKNVVMQNGGEVMQSRNVVYRQNEMPKKVIEQSNDFVLRVPQMEVVQQKVLISKPKVADCGNVSQQKVFIRNDNPFLPAASPVSAMTASSSNSLPPATPKSRGQFLRKIPIPPPTL